MSDCVVRCKDCKYWGQFSDGPAKDKGQGYGLCDSPKFFFGYDQERPWPLDGMAFHDAEDYNAWASVGPEFGCTHGESR